MGCGTNILAAALRLLSAQAVELDNPSDLDTVLKRQKVDGGWEMGWLWKYGKEDVMIGSRGVVTAMAVKAIENAQALELNSSGGANSRLNINSSS